MAIHALLTDLLKSFDCIDSQLIIAKLNSYGVDIDSLYFLASYLEKREKRAKVNSSYINFDDIFSSASQGFILGPLLFNKYICHLFFRIGDLDIAIYAADNTPLLHHYTIIVTRTLSQLYITLTLYHTAQGQPIY